MEKELFVPFTEQRPKMKVGRRYIVCLDLDTKTDRLYASNRIARHLQNENLTIKEKEEFRKTEEEELEKLFADKDVWKDYYFLNTATYDGLSVSDRDLWWERSEIYTIKNTMFGFGSKNKVFKKAAKIILLYFLKT